VIHCGISVNDFWELSWYELQLYMARLHETRETEQRQEEAAWQRTSVLWSTIINMAGKVSKRSVKPDDLLKKGDKGKKPVIMSPEEVDKLMGATLKKERKAKNVK